MQQIVKPPSSKKSKKSSKDTGMWVGLGITGAASVAGIAALMLGSKSANAKESETKPEEEKDSDQKEPLPRPPIPDPEPDDIDGDPVDPELDGFDLKTNWGNTPDSLRIDLAYLELITGIKGIARYGALTCYGESRFKPDAHNKTSSERAACKKGFERRVNEWGWEKPAFYEEWLDWGSSGLVGILGSTGAYAGVNDGYIPLLDYNPSVLYRVDANMYVLGWITYRAIRAYPVKTFEDCRIVHAYPDALKRPEKYPTLIQGIRGRFQQAQEDTGIDASLLPKPALSKPWIGAQQLYEQLGVNQS